jgi:hypothetical protein
MMIGKATKGGAEMDGLTGEETAIVELALEPTNEEALMLTRKLGPADTWPGEPIERTTELGIAVTTTPAGIRDMYWMHAVMAGELAARAWDARDAQLLTTLNRHHEAYLKALDTGAPGREATLFNENWLFHSAIHDKADSPAIAVTVRKTVRYFPDFSLDIPGWYEVGAVWQEQVIRQFENGTREGARKAVVNGSSKSAELYIAALWPVKGQRRTSRRTQSIQGPTRSLVDAVLVP